MGWYKQIILVIGGLLFGSSCKDIQQGPKTPATFQAPAGAATQGDGVVMKPAEAPQPTGPVQAKLSGYPDAKSPNSQFDISVTGVAEYKWKIVDSATDCQSSWIFGLCTGCDSDQD
jgi:hypothetical protein